jgi:hypothetical protein
MTYLFVIFIFVNGVWVQGDELEGWASMPYDTLESCLDAVSRAEVIQKDLVAGLQVKNIMTLERKTERHQLNLLKT